MGTKRSFDELAVTATGVQTFEQRFPGKRRRGDIDQDVPPIAQWRCNLTGLSQVHNLYFVAYGSDLYCYVPQYPTQALPPLPVLVLKSTPTDPNLRGHLDTTEPHAVNNLVVQFLGTEEVVAVVRDDGDVEAFLVRHVVSAIERRGEAGCELSSVADEVKPIIHDNVGNSAWGLAVHTNARIIAVSSNNHEVRVFKFALLDEYEGEDIKSSVDGEDGGVELGEAAPRERRTDVRQEILNGHSNIPHISFCNTGDDPEARWLLTTDISGFCRVMDLHATGLFDAPCQTFRFGPNYFRDYGSGHGHDPLNSGWGIMFLDRRSFVSEPTIEAALGLQPGESLPDARDDPSIWDISKTLRHVKDTSDSFDYQPPPSRNTRRSRGTEDADTNMTDNLSDEARLALVEEILDHYDELSDLDDSDLEGDIYSSPPRTSTYSSPSQQPSSPPLTPTDDNPQPSSMYSGTRICGNTPKFVRQTPLCADLPCPILHTSVRNLYLLQPSAQHQNPGPYNPPFVGLAHPLKQSLRPAWRYLNMFERLNMHAYVPELGVVAVGSQKGRCLVLGLTKCKADVSAKGASGKGAGRGKTCYAMRVEAALPFASQEARGERGAVMLHGIACAPVQGTEDGVRRGKGRWRLLMMYQDHSVLSYEICRKGGLGEGVVV